MIYGIGTDVSDMQRMAEALARHGERFARRILADGELATWQARTARSAQRGVAYLATRFAAKEAFSKAIGLGMCMPMAWRRCEVVSLSSGQPAIALHGELKDWFEARGLRAHLSLTDEGNHASAFVVVEHDAAAHATSL